MKHTPINLYKKSIFRDTLKSNVLLNHPYLSSMQANMGGKIGLVGISLKMFRSENFIILQLFFMHSFFFVASH